MTDLPRGAGGLLTTDLETVDLGTHHGLHLQAEVQRRTLRVGVGGRRGVRFEVARARPTAVRVTGPAGSIRRPVPVNPDPWVAAAQRFVGLLIATSVLGWLGGRARRRAGSAREADE